MIRDSKANAKALAFLNFTQKMPNISFSYLYRDAANYKNHNTIIFNNLDNIPLDTIQTKIKTRLIDGESFHHQEFGVTPLFFKEHDPDLDHNWHEFSNVSTTDQPADQPQTITDFLKL